METSGASLRLAIEEFLKLETCATFNLTVIAMPELTSMMPLSRDRALPVFLIGACFAVPGAAFAWLVVRDAPNGWNVMLPVASALGAGTTAVGLFLTFGRVGENVVAGTMLGAGVGVLAHPVTAVLSLVVAFVLSALGLLPNPPGKASFVIDTPIETIRMVATVAFVWCLMSLCGPIYVTIALGAVTGLILGCTHVRVRRADDGVLENGNGSPPWRSTSASLVSLLLAVLLSLVIVAGARA